MLDHDVALTLNACAMLCRKAHMGITRMEGVQVHELDQDLHTDEKLRTHVPNALQYTEKMFDKSTTGYRRQRFQNFHLLVEYFSPASEMDGLMTWCRPLFAFFVILLTLQKYTMTPASMKARTMRV